MAYMYAVITVDKWRKNASDSENAGKKEKNIGI